MAKGARKGPKKTGKGGPSSTPSDRPKRLVKAKHHYGDTPTDGEDSTQEEGRGKGTSSISKGKPAASSSSSGGRSADKGSLTRKKPVPMENIHKQVMLETCKGL